MNKFNNLYEAIIMFKEDDAVRLVKKYISENKKPEDIISSAQEGLREIGNRFENGEYFTPELIYGGEIVRKILEKVEPLLKNTKSIKRGKVILGTVFGDIHNIGKDLVKLLLQGDGFEVIDLGEDVDPKEFIEVMKSNSDAKLIGLSALLTMSFNSISKTVNEIKEAGLRDNVKIMVGGAPVTELVKESTGCDFYGKDAYQAIYYARDIYS
jgi:5-methyltetrahydrofolate--homocysteine methyltransferase